MNFLFLIFVVLSSFVFSCFFLRFLIPHLCLWSIDQPNHRSSHLKATPRAGGVVFVCVSTLCSVFALIGGQSDPSVRLPLIAFPLAVVGLLDDRCNLPPAFRYFFQLFTAVVIILLSPLTTSLLLPITFGRLFFLIFILLLIIALTAVINFTNFMDGLDGLVAGCMTVAISSLAIKLAVPWPLWALVGALLGFLTWNWSPAKVFMGDVGSTFLGAVFAGLVFQASSFPQALGLLFVATPLLGDACICVLRRILVGQRVFEAHRLHLFQRLYQAGWSHARVSLVYFAATAVLSIALLVGDWQLVIGLSGVELLAGVWLDQRVAVPFAVASHS